MINNIINGPNSSSFTANFADTNMRKNKNTGKVSFGYRDDDYTPHPVRDLFLTLTNDMVGLVGINTALWWVQNFVNGKILVGKINKHFTDKIKDNNKLKKLAFEMREYHELHDGPQKVNMKFDGKPGEAFYTHVGNNIIPANSVVVGKNNYSSLFHELGHAVEENKTNIFKKLQRFRGNYTILALGLYALLSQNKKPQSTLNKSKNQGIGAKIKNFLSKSNAIIPILAFSPELITEAKASIEGLKFLKTKISNKSALYKNIRASYFTCFLTYLFVPVSIMLMDSLQRSVEKRIQRKREYY